MTDSSDIGPIEPKRGTPEITPQSPPPQQSRGEETQRPFPKIEGESTASQSNAPSPIDLATSQATKAQEVTQASLGNQFDQVNQRLAKLHTASTPERWKQLDPEEQRLLQEQLGQFSRTTQNSAQQLDLQTEHPLPPKIPEGLQTFLGWITQSQHTMQHATENLKNKTTGSISPEKMLVAQANLMAADRAVNLATAIISLGLQGFKQVMQTQI